jgi:hypothetical protein
MPASTVAHSGRNSRGRTVTATTTEATISGIVVQV